MPRIAPWTYLRKRPTQVIKSPKASPRVSFDAKGRIIKAYVRQHEEGRKEPAFTEAKLSRPAMLAKAKEDDRPHFKTGLKEVWLPDIPVTFIQTRNLHPRFAKFKVPLNLGKLDFRDFLYHGYGVRALNIRSWVYQRPVESVDYRDIRSSKPKIQWHRRQALKYMIVEMDEAFVWPELPSDLSAFDKGLSDAMRVESYRREDSITSNSGVTRFREDWKKGTDDIKDLGEFRTAIAAQARDMLAGKTRWRPTKEIYPKPRFL